MFDYFRGLKLKKNEWMRCGGASFWWRWCVFLLRSSVPAESCCIFRKTLIPSTWFALFRNLISAKVVNKFSSNSIHFFAILASRTNHSLLRCFTLVWFFHFGIDENPVFFWALCILIKIGFTFSFNKSCMGTIEEIWCFKSSLLYKVM